MIDVKNTDIDDAFEVFMRAVYPSVNQTDVQWKESRRIFYAGMAQLFAWENYLTQLSDTKALVKLQGIYKQLKQFQELVAEDKD